MTEPGTSHHCQHPNPVASSLLAIVDYLIARREHQGRMGRFLAYGLRGQDKVLGSLAVKAFQPRRHPSSAFSCPREGW